MMHDACKGWMDGWMELRTFLTWLGLGGLVRIALFTHVNECAHSRYIVEWGSWGKKMEGKKSERAMINDQKKKGNQDGWNGEKGMHMYVCGWMNV